MDPTFAPSVDDAALLQRYAGAADPAAFAELVRRYAGMVYATARRVTGDPSIAEDVSQDCFLRLARASDAIQGSLPAWLHRTSLNRSLELLRSDRARRRREAESAALVRDATTSKGDDSAQLIAHVDEAMGRLPDDLRVLLTEHFLCGRTQQQLAAELRVDQSTVSRRIERALSDLRDRLRAEGIAIAALPLVLGSTASATMSSTPPALHLALTKIGLSGVRGSQGSGATASVSRSTAAAKSSVGAAVGATAAALVIFAGGTLWLRHAQTRNAAQRSAIPTAAPVATSPTTAPIASAKRDDDDDDDGADDVNDKDDKKDGKLFDF